ncbi:MULTISPECIES: type II toxin-antitoxin system YhaV family toxin [Acetobacter]|uniref:type II toxin-antitoxin system YhaV family toxin n=1 Tax=Acetobacter TaxID=434 RepID=UPI0023DD71B9|nr:MULTISPECIES: type II toxin-antitoxin system YhaV family toxin [Acetobacter]
MNDENNLRTYAAKTDAYKVFKRMLENGNPSDSWAALCKEASDQEQLTGWKFPRLQIRDEYCRVLHYYLLSSVSELESVRLRTHFLR